MLDVPHDADDLAPGGLSPPTSTRLPIISFSGSAPKCWRAKASSTTTTWPGAGAILRREVAPGEEPDAYVMVSMADPLDDAFRFLARPRRGLALDGIAHDHGIAEREPVGQAGVPHAGQGGDAKQRLLVKGQQLFSRVVLGVGQPQPHGQDVLRIEPQIVLRDLTVLATTARRRRAVPARADFGDDERPCARLRRRPIGGARPLRAARDVRLRACGAPASPKKTPVRSAKSSREAEHAPVHRHRVEAGNLPRAEAPAGDGPEASRPSAPPRRRAAGSRSAAAR